MRDPSEGHVGGCSSTFIFSAPTGNFTKLWNICSSTTISRKRLTCCCHYAGTGRALDLLRSYLSNRIQRVDVNGVTFVNRMGEPQGSEDESEDQIRDEILILLNWRKGLYLQHM
ncbi:hypothetical protein EVAR_79815_1 [Eumeta japonica]|uniref:Uncharacterized protein n=1 Tax=Eumeta variegata TaxID=151549 RepID=A0A4C1WTE9_EUMVA|nr:hypothetical protein EVAR_79815_1 [Eumeta japonica]